MIAVHLRLDDRANMPSTIQQIYTHFQMMNQINDGSPVSVDRQCQATISDAAIEKLLARLKTEHPDHAVCFFTSPGSDTALAKCYPFYLVDVSTTIWNMMHADVLVLSRSTFSLCLGTYASVINPKAVIHYPAWSHAAASGLGTKYDKTNWKVWNDFE